MKHVCIRDFQRDFYNQIKDLKEPIVVTKYGVAAFTVSAVSDINSSVTSSETYEGTKTKDIN